MGGELVPGGVEGLRREGFPEQDVIDAGTPCRREVLERWSMSDPEIWSESLSPGLPGPESGAWSPQESTEAGSAAHPMKLGFKGGTAGVTPLPSVP